MTHQFLPDVTRCRRLLLLPALAAALWPPSPAWAQSYALKTLHTFNGTDSEFPAGLTRDGAGNLYGTAHKGGPTGSDNNGIIYKFSAAGVLTTLGAFDGLDGDSPAGSPVLDAAGNLWGMTAQGGVGWDPQINHFGEGTVYKISAAGVFTPGVVEFNGPHGANPIGGLTFDAAGDLLGATYQGGAPWDPSLGAFGLGTVFQMSSAGVVSTALLLDGGNGSYPNAGVAVDAQGNVYGTTQEGGAFGDGTLYKISPGGVATTLVTFRGVNGKNPTASVTIDGQGNLYGTTQQGGVTAINNAVNGFGTVWEYSATGQFRTLVSFNGVNGMFPAYGVTQDGAGNLFGSTINGGVNGNGVLFEYSAGGVLSTLVDFDGATQGADPDSPICVDGQGNLYGAANLGGATGNGTLFELQPVSTTLGVTGVTVSPATVAGGGTAQGTVTLSGPAPSGGLIVTLGTSNSQVTPEGPITVPAGATGANFTVSTQAVTDTTPVAISARVGGTTQQATLTVAPLATFALALIQVSPDTIQGGTSSTGTITLNRVAPAGGIAVSLSSSSTLLSVPAGVTVPAGATSASFPITTQPVSSSTSVTLTATLGASSLQYTPLLTTPLPYSLANLSVNLATVQGGTPLVGRVMLSRPAGPGGITVALASGSPAVTVPASVTVPAGVGVVSFPVQTAAGATASATISAALGSSSLQTGVTVLAPTPAAVSGLTISPSSVTGGTSSQGTVTLTAVAPAGGAVITLSASGGPVGMPATVAVSAGESTASFAITTAPVTAPTGVTVTAAVGGSAAQAALTVFPAAPPPVPTAVTFSPASVTGGTGATGTVTLNAIAPLGGLTVTLSSNSASASVPASVTVPPNANTATFAVSTQPVTASAAVTVTASEGGGSAQGTLTLTPVSTVSVSSLTVSPTSLKGGNSAQGTVTLSGAAPAGGAAVTLSSSNTAVASVPASVTVAAGRTSATFAVTTRRPPSDTAVTLSGTFGGVTRSASLTVRH